MALLPAAMRSILRARSTRVRRAARDLQAGGGGGGSSLLRRWQSSLPQLDHVDRSDDEIDWDNLGFGLTPTDYMYVMRSSPEDLGAFPRGELCRYGNIELSPSSGVLNYAQGLFEGMKAYRRPGRAGYTLFRPEENARRMQFGAERMCMPAPSVDQFVSAVKETVLANRRAAAGKGGPVPPAPAHGERPDSGAGAGPRVHVPHLRRARRKLLQGGPGADQSRRRRRVPPRHAGQHRRRQDDRQLRAGAQGTDGRQEQGIHGRAVPRLGAQAVPGGGLVVQRVHRQGRRRCHAGHQGHHPAGDHAQERHRARQGPRLQLQGGGAARLHRRPDRRRRGVLHRHGGGGGAGVDGDEQGAE
ncbi:hypothetical protein PVAP13_9KG460353 [Panicum virgatum]|nr:hypothetical protein PVAP13_9KG460353 [Panicum virgatum]KAG2553603.1 hypothetical protein PVAP13_9KG460353 [Panicum virgatum]KAG2553605.1 hypothetical protein PVAP13_9KG460353 [Panicum virgatum]